LSEPSNSSAKSAPSEDLEDLYENAPCGYLSVQADSRIFKSNLTFSRWIGFSPEELTGKRLHDLLSIAGRIFYETHFAPLLRMQGFFDEVALDLVTKSGALLPVLVNAAERKDPAGNLVFIRMTVFNATDRRRYERDLISAREELKAFNATLEKRVAEALAGRLRSESSLRSKEQEADLREQFIAVLGHDLRNPLAAIGSGTKLLLREPMDDKSREIVALMQGSVLRMTGLIDNVLDFARGRLGDGITLNQDDREPLEATLNQVVEEFRSIAPDRVIDTDLSLPSAVWCDRARIGQMVSNLLGNALTYGDPGEPVRVHASIEAGELVLGVANKGNPIPDNAMERLFQPFFRGDVRPSQQGLGLGLFIASEIARAHGGSLTVASSDEETRFTFRMPVKHPAP
jgi:phosphoserine phosphatase RsbU/P